MQKETGTEIEKSYWPSFLLFAGARREHSIVSPLLQKKVFTETSGGCVIPVSNNSLNDSNIL